MKIKQLLLILLILASVKTFSQDVKFTAVVEKVVEVGETFRLTFDVNEQGSNFTPPDLSNFKYSGPTTQSSSSIQVINGQMTRNSSYSYTYYMVAPKAGKYSIGPAQITVKGKVYKTNAVEVEAIGGGTTNKGNTQQNSQQGNTKASGDDGETFLRIELNKGNIFLGEPVIATVKIYTRSNLVGFDEQPKFPSFNGFWNQDIETANQIVLERQNVGGKIYNAGVIKKYLLFPQKTGDLYIDPAEITCVLQKQVRAQSWFDNGVRNFNMRVASPRLKVNVKPLPANQPADFKGTVGTFTMKAAFDKLKTKTNEPVTLRIAISGSGNIKLIDPFDITFPPDFETYKPEVKVNFKNSVNGQIGNKTFEYLSIPRHAGQFKVGPISFTYFDLNSKTYKTLTSEEFVIDVEKGSDDEANTQMFRPNNKSDVKTLTSDIRFIKTNKPNFRPIGKLFAGSPVFYLSFLIPLILFILIFIVRRKQVKEASNVLLVKNRGANKISKKRLKASADYLKKGEKEKFYSEVLRATWGYVSDKLGIPVSELTKENIVGDLQKQNIDDELISKMIEVLDTCEFARYAPIGEASQMDHVYNDAVSVISKLEQKLR